MPRIVPGISRVLASVRWKILFATGTASPKTPKQWHGFRPSEAELRTADILFRTMPTSSKRCHPAPFFRAFGVFRDRVFSLAIARTEPEISNQKSIANFVDQPAQPAL